MSTDGAVPSSFMLAPIRQSLDYLAASRISEAGRQRGRRHPGERKVSGSRRPRGVGVADQGGRNLPVSELSPSTCHLRIHQIRGSNAVTARCLLLGPSSSRWRTTTYHESSRSI